jgi:hypothetical protein
VWVDLTAWDTRLVARLDASHPLWGNQPSYQATKPEYKRITRGFYAIQEDNRPVPSGPWSADETQRIIGGLGWLLFSYTWKASLPLLLMGGMGEAQAQGVVGGWGTSRPVIIQ